MKVTVVTWHDAHGDSAGWIAIDSIAHTPCVVKSVGFVLPPETKPGHMSLAQSLLHGDLFADHIVHIPLGMIADVAGVDW